MFPLNNHMTTELIQNLPDDQHTDKVKISSRGGARAGAGRPRGSRDRVTVQSLLETLTVKTGGLTYEELLIDDFLNARLSDDKVMIHKYHTLISNKLISTLATIEVSDSDDTLQRRQAAFAEAIAQITGINTQD